MTVPLRVDRSSSWLVLSVNLGFALRLGTAPRVAAVPANFEKGALRQCHFVSTDLQVCGSLSANLSLHFALV